MTKIVTVTIFATADEESDGHDLRFGATANARVDTPL
jgi:hypothetical protein